MKNEFIEVKDYFDNGYKTWDGCECPNCHRVFDPDSLTTVRNQGGDNADYRCVCPVCYFTED